MAATYELLGSTVLTSLSNSVAFTGISSAFTDLHLRAHVRTSNTGSGVAQVTINSITGGYDKTNLQGDGSAVTAATSANQSLWSFSNYIDSDGATSTTAFGIVDIYLSNIQSTVRKNGVALAMSEDESSANTYTRIQASGIGVDAGATITTLTIDCNNISPFGFKAGSSFRLYGIKNT